MPEGHTLHRIARDHSKWFSGQIMIVTSPQGRFEKEATELSGQKLLRAEAFGKHLFYTFGGRERPKFLHVHLGLYGKFRVHRNAPPEPRGAVRVRMLGEERSFDLNGPNTCELLDTQGLQAIQKRLGPDPLRSDADPERAWAKISRSRSAIGALLLNQSVIAGLGNIYRAEILYLLGIDPKRIGKKITRDEFEQIWELSCELLRIGVRYNRIITVLENEKPLSRLKSGERLHVYKKKTCSRCAADIQQWNLANRKIFACDKCQR
ncbi:MAG: DNA-formamidopyrimidine glycosylase family protein [Planctomycetota bacterium]|nr:DNA-formamidopyrimidine glycosylase family protein [Planctomycetota bacterium]